MVILKRRRELVIHTETHTLSGGVLVARMSVQRLYTHACACSLSHIQYMAGLLAASVTRGLTHTRVRERGKGLTGGEERAACVVQGSPNALVTRDQTTARSGDHPTPSSDPSRFSRRSTGWGSNPTPHLSVSLRGDPLQPCHPSALPGRPGLDPSSSLALLLSLTPSFSTFAVVFIVLELPLVHAAVRRGVFTCNSTRVTHHAHTGSSGGPAHVRLK